MATSPTTTSPSAPFALCEDAWGRLVLTDAAGVEHHDVAPVRAFPLSNPRQGVAMVSPAGAEVAWIGDLDALEPALRARIDAALAQREFAPRIRRIIKVHSATEPSHWEVETDRGPTRFVVKNDEDVRQLEPAGALIVDSSGIRYLVADVAALDAASRRYLERYL
jgi:hypothetical protein